MGRRLAIPASECHVRIVDQRRSRYRQPLQITSALGALPSGPLVGITELFTPPADPRYNAFDWETWHELDVLRRELAPRFEAKKP